MSKVYIVSSSQYEKEKIWSIKIGKWEVLFINQISVNIKYSKEYLKWKVLQFIIEYNKVIDYTTNMRKINFIL
jgi:hypothetical protein